jgi:hypothetical protein
MPGQGWSYTIWNMILKQYHNLADHPKYQEEVLEIKDRLDAKLKEVREND